jgi:glycosyltransferase involved in cell wall biosynthesis
LEQSVPFWVTAFLVVYALVALFLFVYGMHAYVLVWLHARGRGSPAAPLPEGPLPRVTVQLPLYNERYVARRLLEAVTALDYPRDLLHIQVLDDSTDDTVHRVAALVARYREEGWKVEHLRRGRRLGYKGGALREGLAGATGDLVVIFDADFVPPPDFLRQTVPAFANPRVGMVQARWSHLNETYSLLTRAQAATLDGHFLVEHIVRNRRGAFINFNGTAGVWRKACILDAGNWQDDTLTEDLDLSYRAQLAGWKFLFLPHVCCPAELPAEVNALKSQQFRWAKGSVQTALKLLPALAREPLPAFTRLQAFIHLTSHAVYPLLLLLGLLSLPGLVLIERHPQAGFLLQAAGWLVVASFGHPWLYGAAQRARGRSWTASLAALPLVVTGNLGIALNNTRAVLEALCGRQSAFERTPKYALRDRGDGWRTKRYRVPSTVWPLLEVLIALYALGAAAYAAAHGRYVAIPFLLLYVAGFGYLGILSIIQGWRPAPAPEGEASAKGGLAAALAD